MRYATRNPLELDARFTYLNAREMSEKTKGEFLCEETVDDLRLEESSRNYVLLFYRMVVFSNKGFTRNFKIEKDKA